MDDSYHRGEITSAEWYQQVINIWNEVTERISGKLEEALDPFGTMMTIVQSGATKARFQQIRQLSGIRGLMASPSGKVLPIPVLSNYLLGLSVWEIFIAASGARKGFMDRSLNTSVSGYLTRRLVEAGMEVWVTETDCGTPEGHLITHTESKSLGLPTMRHRIVGRVLAERVNGLEAGLLLDEQHVDTLLSSGVESLRVRSPLSCRSAYGVCQHCYGADLATGKLVALGTAVGVIAGQSIGEPGTQLTMRTFHSGGIANNTSDITLGLPRVNDLFEVRIPQPTAVLSESCGMVSKIERDEQRGNTNIYVTSTTLIQEEYRIPQECELLVHVGEHIQEGQPLTKACRTSHHNQSDKLVARLAGQVISLNDRQLIVRTEEHEERMYPISAGQVLAVHLGEGVETGTPLVEGLLNPHTVLHLLGQDATQRYLVNEVQRVYRGTGVFIHDKHLEIIVRQMLRYVVVSDGGDTRLLPGSVVDRFTYMHHVASTLAQGGQPAIARPILLGLTQAVLHTRSWIAAASFQNTSGVLAQAVICHQQDNLIGLKEHLVIGKKLPGCEKGKLYRNNNNQD